MDAVTVPSVEDVEWVALEEPTTVGRARRTAEQLAHRLGAPDGRAAEIGIAVTEIASNVQRHAGVGALLLRAVRGPGVAEVEVVALDSGPGIHDLGLARRDGSSTADSLGIGLGAIERLADWVEISSVPDRGTVLVARFALQRSERGGGPVPPTAGITRALAGEDVCGDAYAVRRQGELTVLMVCDGSGHGPLAASASASAVRSFLDPALPAGPPDAVLQRVHGALSGTRGAAVAVAELDPGQRVVRFAGVGNIAGAVLDGDSKRSMVSIGGVAGFRRPVIRTFDYPFATGAAVVLHSDGVRARWSAADVRGLPDRSPLLLAAVLLRDAGLRQDDACVLVGRVAP